MLVVPCNRCSAAQYLRYISEIRSGPSEVRLLDVSVESALHHHNPKLYPQGRILYNFVTSDDNKESIFLHDFEPWRKIFIVVAVGPYSDTPSVSIDQLKTRFPSAIVHNIILFDTPADDFKRLCPPSDHSQRSTFYYSGSLTALETILCLILANFLTALDSYTSSFLTITLRSPVSISDSNTIARTITSAQKRLSSGSFKVTFNSAHGSGQNSPSTESKTRHLGRQQKVLGSFALLAGNYAAASSHFVEAITNLKKVDDNLWLGNALEGLAVSTFLLHYVGTATPLNPSVIPILQLSRSKLSSDMSVSTAPRPSSESSLGSKSLRNSHPAALSPRNSSTSFRGTYDLSSTLPAEVIKLLAFRAIHYYSNTLNDLEDTVPDMVYIDSLIRSIKFAICIYLGGGELSLNVLDAIVRNTKLESNLQGSAVMKTEILKEMDRVFNLQLVDMSVYQQCKLYSCLATMYGDLGLHRKRAFILRTFLVGLLPSIASNEDDNGKMAPAEYSSLREVFEMLFQAYGVDAETESSASAASNVATHWTTIKLLLLKLAVLVGSANHDYQFVVHICTLLLTRFAHCLSSQDQQQTKDRIDSVIQEYALNNSGHPPLSVPYWDPYLVRRVKLVTSKKREELVPFSEIAEQNGSLNLVGKNNAQSDGLIFNPYRRNSTALLKDKLVVKDDLFQLKITLQNPFGFELDIHDIEIVTDLKSTVQTLFSLTKPVTNLNFSTWSNGLTKMGPASNSMPSLNQRPQRPQIAKRNQSGFTRLAVNVPRYDDLSLAPSTIQSFLVTFRPETTGIIEIKGFNIVVGNCNKQTFLIVDEEKFNYSIKLKENQQLMKSSSVMQSLEHCSIGDRASTKSLVLNVIPPQPMLTLSESLIVNGMLMLLEGEKYHFSVTLTNESDHAINYLSFAFWDSTVDTINRQLANAGRNGLSPIDIYNLEWSLIRDKPFSIQNKEAFSGKIIEPHSKLKIDFEVNGKRGMRELKIMLDYANKGHDRSRCFVKLISIPVQFTVLPSLELVNFDVFSLNSTSLLDFDLLNLPEKGGSNALKATVDFLKSLKTTGDIADFCLLALDLRNSWKEVISFNVDGQLPKLELEGCIDPGKTVRVFVPFKRLSWKDTDLHKSIPSLRNKQFVKSKNFTEKEEETHKELFWLKENLLENVKGSWQTALGHHEAQRRTGNFGLRSVRLDPRMTFELLHDRVQLQHEILSDNRPLERSGPQFFLKTDEFYTIRTTIINNLDRTIYGTVRNLPYSLSSTSAKIGGTVGSLVKSVAVSDKKILVNGVLQSHIGHPGVAAHLSHQISTTFVVLEKGEYEWGAILDIFDGESVIGRDPILLQAA